MTKLVFASCMHVGANDSQKVWREAIAHEPEWLVLCGDNIYMDYGLCLYQSRHWSPSRFFREMYERYSAQFEVPSFQQLVASIPESQVVGVWDDHDFAWNNCYGADPSYQMYEKKKIATALYHHYFDALNRRPLATSLPELPIPDSLDPPRGSEKIYRSLDIGPFRALLCDGRSWRREHTPSTTDGTVLGADQEDWLLRELAQNPGPFLLISGSTMTASEDQSWDYFQDFFETRFVPAVQDRLVVFLAGDVHENRLPPRNSPLPIEVVSSGAVLGPIPYRRNFGVMEIQGDLAYMFLIKKGRVQYKSQLNLVTGDYKTSMTLLDDEEQEVATTFSVEHAATQRAQAIEELRSM